MKKLGYLDGLRGLACCEVMLTHYAKTFWPQTQFGNGGGAVALFFILSGYVLTPGFAQLRSVIAPLGARLLRLFLPAMAALLIGLALHAGAGAIAVLIWPAGAPGFTAAVSTAALWRDLSGFSMLFGYAECAVFDMPGLVSRNHSLIPPLWTLNIEMLGSVLVSCLVMLRRYSAMCYPIALIALVVLIGSNELILFVIGHLLAGRPLQRRPVLAFVAIVIGGLLFHLPLTMESVSGLLPGALRVTTATPAQLLGAALIFYGVLAMPAAQRVLQTPAIRWLGSISFSVYLLHWPVLMTASSLVYVAVRAAGLPGAAMFASATGTALTLGLAVLFTRYVDMPVIALARSVRQREVFRGGSSPGHLDADGVATSNVGV